MDNRYGKKAPTPQDPMDVKAWDIENALIGKYPEMHSHTIEYRVTDCPEYIMPAATQETFYWSNWEQDVLLMGGPDLNADDEYDYPHEGPAVQ